MRDASGGMFAGCAEWAGRSREMAFANQTVLITGAASGIGWELARVLGGQGARVGLIARRRDNLVALAAEIQAAGGRAEVEAADVGNREQIRDAIAALEARLGPSDLLVANAGLGAPTTV